MYNNEERGFTDYGFDKRYGETYDQAFRRHANEAADSREKFTPKQKDSNSPMFGAATSIAAPSGPRKVAAKWAIRLGWLIILTTFLVWQGFVDLGITDISGYETQTVLFYSALSILAIGYFGEWVGLLLFILGAYCIYTAFANPTISLMEDCIFGGVFILIGGLLKVVFGRK